MAWSMATITPGATPKVTTSASESSCPPKSLVVRVMRATRPSSMSKIIARRIATAACWKAVAGSGALRPVPSHWTAPTWMIA